MNIKKISRNGNQYYQLFDEKNKFVQHIGNAEAKLGEILKQEQAAGRLAGQDTGNRNLSNNVVTLKDIGISKMESSRAERKLGEMLGSMEKNPGTVLGGNIVQPPSDTPKLSDLGIAKVQSHRWQRVSANIPEDGAKGIGSATKISHTLADVGINRNDSPKFRVLARIPEVVEKGAVSGPLPRPCFTMVTFGQLTHDAHSTLF